MRKNLLQLVLDNRAAPKQNKIVNANGEATIYIYDVIGGYWGGVDAQEFAKQLAALDVSQINLRVNSPGGDVFEARAIMSALAAHPANITGYVDGLAASAATSILMAADKVVMTRGARYMIHKAWGITMGNDDDHIGAAALLTGIDQEIVKDYAGKTGKDEQQIVDWMKAETWFSAEQAVEQGFVDEVVEATAKQSNWNLSAYANAPKPEIPKHDMAAMHRRLSLLERTAA